MIAVTDIVADIVAFCDTKSKQNAFKEEHQTQGPTPQQRTRLQRILLMNLQSPPPRITAAATRHGVMMIRMTMIGMQ
jgi:hypothetical protein